MENLLNSAITVGPIVLGLGLLLAAGCGLAYLVAPGPKAGTVLLRFVLLTAAIGIAAFVAGTGVGIAVFCALPASGNLCGLGGVFGIGPILSGLAMGGYACIWLKRVRHRTGH
jgi:hypothetical protein